jgi:hypothetical protein
MSELKESVREEYRLNPAINLLDSCKFPFMYKLNRPFIDISSIIIKEVTKEQYNKILRDKRREFMDTYYHEQLIGIFRSLQEHAEQMKPLFFDIELPTIEMMDIEKLQNLISLYFKDLGYNCTIGIRKGSGKLAFMLT